MSAAEEGYCTDRSHGITCRNQARGPGAYCRVCGRQVSSDDVHARTVLERIRSAIGGLKYLVHDAPETGELVGPWLVQLKAMAAGITGQPEDHSPEAPKL